MERRKSVNGSQGLVREESALSRAIGNRVNTSLFLGLVHRKE
jgi:hypothetical protein